MGCSPIADGYSRSAARPWAQLAAAFLSVPHTARRPRACARPRTPHLAAANLLVHGWLPVATLAPERYGAHANCIVRAHARAVPRARGWHGSPRPGLPGPAQLRFPCRPHSFGRRTEDGVSAHGSCPPLIGAIAVVTELEGWHRQARVAACGSRHVSVRRNIVRMSGCLAMMHMWA